MGSLERDTVEEMDRLVAEAVRRWPAIDAATETAVTRIEKGQRLIQRAQSATLAKVGLTHEEVGVLLQICLGPRSHGDLCRDMLVSTGAMTNRLDKLERSGLLRRLRDPHDRRGVLIEITDAGDRMLDAYADVGGKRERELLSVLDADELAQLNHLLTKLVAHLNAEVGPPPKRRTARERADEAP